MRACRGCERAGQGWLGSGEDLGTVHEGLRELRDDWGIWTYFILLFARTEDGAILPPAEFPARALAAFNTHDLPTFAGWWTGRDLEEMIAAGLALGESAAERDTARQALREALLQAGIAAGDEPDFPSVARLRSEEHTSELQSLMRISYAVFCLKTTQHT